MATPIAQRHDTRTDPEMTGAAPTDAELRARRRLSLAPVEIDDGSGAATRTAARPSEQVAPPQGAATEIDSLAQPVTHRRRTRWFELNPGCFGRAALWGAGVAAGTAAAGGLSLWAAWRLRRAVRVVRTTRALWRGYRRLRGRATARGLGSPRAMRGRSRR